MRTINYVPAACRERCTTRLVNIRVILKFSFKNLRAYEYRPKHKHLLAKSTKSCHACLFFAVFGAFLARFAPPVVNSCVSNMPSSSGVVFAAFFGGFSSSTHDSSGQSGTGFLTSWSRRRHDCHTIRLVYAVITYSYVQLHLLISRGFCLLAFRPMHLANIDWFSSCR
jgi:hypothetical protein